MLLSASMLSATILSAATLCPPAQAAPVTWQRPAQQVLDVLHAPRLPWVWTSPTGGHLLLADPITYPPLSEFSAGWLELAGVRVDPKNGGSHARPGGAAPRVVSVAAPEAEPTPLPLPDGAELQDVDWHTDGQRFALTVEHPDGFSLWVGDVAGSLTRIEGVSPHPQLGDSVRWMPDGKHLLVRHTPDLGAPPAAPEIPSGPMVTQSSGGAARSTYEARNLLQTAHDDALFTHYMTSQPVLVHAKKGSVTPLAEPDTYAWVTPSPSGKYLLVEKLVGPWSHEVGWWRFAQDPEVWDRKGHLVADLPDLPLADNVPAHGVATGHRWLDWRATEPHQLVWVEALDGGDPVAEVPHRDRLMTLERPFDGEPEEVWRAEHRVVDWKWAEDGRMMLTERERMKRWRYTWMLDVDSGDAKAWYDTNERDRYGDPGSPVTRRLDSGHRVLRQDGDAVYFVGTGGSPEGDRPFLDRRRLGSDQATRLFRSAPDRYERFVAFAGDTSHFVFRSESPVDPPNYWLAALGAETKATEGESARAHERAPITRFADPTPRVRELDKRLVTYERADGVPLSFQLYLPPGYKDGDGPLPTVLHAYPQEYSDASTAGQVRGSTQRFDRISAGSALHFALQGYAVLSRTAMPMVGDPETVYDTFVPQLVADAEAAVAKAVELGVADPDRIAVFGHSHGGLMVANLLAHTDLFATGIARSGSYNKTNQPFGFQSERRSLFDARDAYIQVSPTFFADRVQEPVLILHGDADSNPGTLTFQSQVFYDAVRGSGGTARLVLLPFEDHGYRARETVEHVLWEQLSWLETHLRGDGQEPNEGDE